MVKMNEFKKKNAKVFHDKVKLNTDKSYLPHSV